MVPWDELLHCLARLLLSGGNAGPKHLPPPLDSEDEETREEFNLLAMVSNLPAV